MFDWSKLSNLFKSKQQNQNETNLPTGKTYQEQIQHDYQKAVDYEKNSTNPKFHRTTREENLAFNFSDRHSSTLNVLETEVYEETNKVFTIFSTNERIEQCKKAIKAYENLKKFCLSKGKGGQIHFEDMWEHCHNSKSPDFRFIEKLSKN